MTETERRAIREARADGASLRELGRQYGVSHETIRLNLAGDDPKPPVVRRKRPSIRGIHNHNATLNEWAVCGIMALLLMGHHQRDVSRRYGLNHNAAWMIWNRKNWRWLFEEEEAP